MPPQAVQARQPPNGWRRRHRWYTARGTLWLTEFRRRMDAVARQSPTRSRAADFASQWRTVSRRWRKGVGWDVAGVLVEVRGIW
jgi:hypothetical protein